MRFRRLVPIAALVTVLIGSLGMHEATALTRRQRVLQLVNRQRTSHGLRTVSLNRSLSSYADVHTARMAESGRLYHTINLRARVSPFSAKCWGENVGYAGTIRRVMTLFMRSYAHRENILNRCFRRVAIGTARVRGYTWITMILYG